MHYELYKIRNIRFRNRLRCDACGKVFKSEDYLNKHLTTKHFNLINNNNNNEDKICTAKFCSFLHCAKNEETRMDMHKHHNHPQTERGRQFCKSTLSQCFPLESVAKKQYEFLVNYYCFGIYPAEGKKSTFSFGLKLLAWFILVLFLLWYLINSMCTKAIKGKSTLNISPSKNKLENKTQFTPPSSSFGNSFLRKRSTPTNSSPSNNNNNNSVV